MIYNPLYIKLSLICLLLLIFVNSVVNSQNEQPSLYKTRMKFEYIKKTDDSKWLKTTLASKITKKYRPQSGEKITFFIVNDSLEQTLGKAITNRIGEILFSVPSINKRMIDSAGYYNFYAKYEGSNMLKATQKELSVRDAKMNVILSLNEDSLKLINISTVSIGANDEEIPLAEADVYCYVKRLFGNLTIGEGFLEDGKLEVELADDFSLPGNAEGEIIVITRIEDSEEIGTVENESLVKWGIPMIQLNQPEDLNQTSWLKLMVILILFVGPFIILFSQLLKFYRLGKFSKST